MNKELTGIKDWSHGDLETFSQEAYELLRWIREFLGQVDFEDELDTTATISLTHDTIYDFLTEWETPLDED